MRGYLTLAPQIRLVTCHIREQDMIKKKWINLPHIYNLYLKETYIQSNIYN